MKSNKALETGVSQETYCRHGFHEWIEIGIHHSKKTPKNPTHVKRCKHCGRIFETR